MYTPNGLKSIRVLGALRKKSKNLSFCEPITEVSAIITEQKFPALVEYNIVNNHSKIKEDYEKTILTQGIFELIKQVNLDSFSLNIYMFLKRTLSYLENSNLNYLIISTFFIKLTKVFGINPDFTNMQTFYESGFKYNSSVDLYTLYKYLYNIDDKSLLQQVEIDEAISKTLLKSIVEFYTYNLGYNFKFFKNLL